MRDNSRSPAQHSLSIRFRIALTLDQVSGRPRSVSAWAEECCVVPHHVYHVLEGRAVSDRIEALMEIYIAKVFGVHRVRIGGDSATSQGAQAPEM